MDQDIKLYGRLFLHANIKTLTGMIIGGHDTGLEIGGVDKTIIRNPLTNRPYIPGSSLRGKMRSQTEKALGVAQNNRIGQVTIHTCKQPEEYNGNGGRAVGPGVGVSGGGVGRGPGGVRPRRRAGWAAGTRAFRPRGRAFPA